MPGGRLTAADRAQIAAGLADGLGYALVARQLGRPTSTISREVARNGGPTGYRADRAADATGQRARRRPAAPTGRAAPPGGTAADGRDTPAVRDYEERFAQQMVHTGLPRMAARVLTGLVTTDSGTLTAAELVQRLRVSPASVSKAIGYLEGLELVRRERDPRRRERYVVDDDVWLRTWTTSARRHSTWADIAERGVEVYGAATPVGARLAHMGRFFGRLSEDMAGGPVTPEMTDALSVLTALVRGVAPDARVALAESLGWPPARLAGALREAESQLGL